MTDEQIEELRARALEAGDYQTVDICDVALAPHERRHANGAPLHGPGGKRVTRSQARAELERLFTDEE